MTLEFEIVGLPKTPNALLGAHWTIRSGHAKKWKRLVAEAVRVQLKSPPPQLSVPSQLNMPLSSATLTCTRISSNKPDYDGLAGSFKSLIDGLVECGVLTDDTPDVIGQPTYLWERGPRLHGKVRICVEAAA